MNMNDTRRYTMELDRIIIISGPMASGKTTLMYILSDPYKRNIRRIAWDRHDVDRKRQRDRLRNLELDDAIVCFDNASHTDIQRCWPLIRETNCRWIITTMLPIAVNYNGTPILQIQLERQA